VVCSNTFPRNFNMKIIRIVDTRAYPVIKTTPTFNNTWFSSIYYTIHHCIYALSNIQKWPFYLWSALLCQTLFIPWFYKISNPYYYSSPVRQPIGCAPLQWIYILWFIENRSTHFTAYRLFDLPNFVRKESILQTI
jgi:hypothetical protein